MDIEGVLGHIVEGCEFSLDVDETRPYLQVTQYFEQRWKIDRDQFFHDLGMPNRERESVAGLHRQTDQHEATDARALGQCGGVASEIPGDAVMRVGPIGVTVSLLIQGNYSIFVPKCVGEQAPTLSMALDSVKQDLRWISLGFSIKIAKLEAVQFDRFSLNPFNRNRHCHYESS